MAEQRRYQVYIDEKAEKQLAALPTGVQSRVGRKIDGLELDPRPRQSKKLKGGSADTYRIRVGSYRIIYCIDDDVPEVLVVRIRHRKDAYRRM